MPVVGANTLTSTDAAGRPQLQSGKTFASESYRILYGSDLGPIADIPPSNKTAAILAHRARKSDPVRGRFYTRGATISGSPRKRSTVANSAGGVHVWSHRGRQRIYLLVVRSLYDVPKAWICGADHEHLSRSNEFGWLII